MELRYLKNSFLQIIKKNMQIFNIFFKKLSRVYFEGYFPKTEKSQAKNDDFKFSD